MKVGYQVLADLQQQQAFKQWGENVGGGGQTVSLPISFEVAFTAVVSADSSWCNASCHITTTTITTMNYQSNRPDIAQAGPVQWLALGCQLQWGVNRTNGIYSFPIPFTEALCCFGGGEAGSGYYDNASAYSNTQVRVYSDGSSRFVSWIAIGS